METTSELGRVNGQVLKQTQCIFWINGSAGTGKMAVFRGPRKIDADHGTSKTTIAYTVADGWRHTIESSLSPPSLLLLSSEASSTHGNIWVRIDNMQMIKRHSNKDNNLNQGRIRNHLTWRKIYY
jgi:hypothetical protein